MIKSTETETTAVKRGPGRPRKVAAPDQAKPLARPDDDPFRVIGLAEAAQLCSVSTRTIKRIERSDPDFPKPFTLGGRVRNWLFGDMRAYVLKKAGKTAA
jgi:predicted DNA-binding transcriptional regulator AlpA